jgi:hypothetical protein
LRVRLIAISIAITLGLTGCAEPYTLTTAEAEALMLSTPYLDEYSQPPKFNLSGDGSMGLLDSKCFEATKVELLGKKAKPLAARGFQGNSGSVEFWRESAWKFETEQAAKDLIESLKTALKSSECTNDTGALKSVTTEAKPVSIALVDAPEGIVYDRNVESPLSYTVRTYLLQKGNIVVKTLAWQTNDGLSEALIHLDELTQDIASKMNAK